MAALNFPTSPNVNDVYTANSRSFVWDGVSWVSRTGVGPTGPTGPTGVSGSTILFDTTLGADTATIDTGAAGIPSGYHMLEIYVFGRTDEAVKSSGILMQFNADSAANYCRQYEGAANATQIANDTTADTGVTYQMPGSTFLASAPGLMHVTVPGYLQTTFFKVAHVNGGSSSTTAADGIMAAQVTTWRSTAAITRVAISVTTGGKKFVAGSRMIIYGR